MPIDFSNSFLIICYYLKDFYWYFSSKYQPLGSIPGLGRFPGEGNGNHSTILAWKIPWTEEPGGLQPMESDIDTTERLFHCFSD